MVLLVIKKAHQTQFPNKVPHQHRSQAIIYDIFNLDITLDILVVDDQSPDGTAKQVIKLMKSFPERLFLENRTKKEHL